MNHWLVEECGPEAEQLVDATSESLRRHHENNIAVSCWVNVRKFAR